MNKAQASLSQSTWAEVSSFTPHPYTKVCLPNLVGKMSSRGVMPSEKTSYHPVLSSVKGHNLTLLPGLGPKINSEACLRVLPGHSNYPSAGYLTSDWVSQQHCSQ
jgi:hypothetical protein